MESTIPRLLTLPQRTGRPAYTPPRTSAPCRSESQDTPSRTPPPPIRVRRSPASQTSQTTSPRTTPQQMAPPRQRAPPGTDTPRSSRGNYAIVYVAVFEHRGAPPAGSTKAIMRKSNIVVERDPRKNRYLFHGIVEDPSTKEMVYRCSLRKDPRWTRPTLLAMDVVVWIPQDRVADLPSIFRQVESQPREGWNSQNFVREALRKLVNAGLMKDYELRQAIRKLNEAVYSPVSLETPNLLPRIFDRPQKGKYQMPTDHKKSGS